MKAVLLMTKTPGRLPVKTRLAPALGTPAAEALYACFLRDIGAKFRALGLPLRVHHLPGEPDEIPILSALLGQAAGFYPQAGQELGTRMRQAFEAGFAAGYQHLLLIGGDCPDLPPDTFTAAFAALDQHDCVLGPTRDGGYYLLAFSRGGFTPALFDFPDWSAATVYAETIRRLQAAGRSLLELPAWSDVDTLDDLQRMRQRSATGWFSGSATQRFLAGLNLPEA